MVSECQAAQQQKMFVIEPNQPMAWNGLLLAYGCIAAVTLAVGMYFWLQGLLLVLPFAGLELLLLGAALYVTARRGGIKEVITISPDAVLLESGRHRPNRSYNFQRQWAKVVLIRPDADWHPSRLLIRSHGKEVEVGRFLNEHERCCLAKELKLAI